MDLCAYFAKFKVFAFQKWQATSYQALIQNVLESTDPGASNRVRTFMHFEAALYDTLESV